MKRGIDVCPGSGQQPLAVYPANRAGKCPVCRSVQRVTQRGTIHVHGKRPDAVA